jgi:hypothetical protein
MRRQIRWYYLLLLLPLVLLWVPHYNRIEPALAGVPFFYWYQMAWVIITAVLTWLVWHLDGGDGA